MVIIRHSRDIGGIGSLAPRGEDKWTGNDKVDEPVCPPPSTTGRQRMRLSFVHENLSFKLGLTDW